MAAYADALAPVFWYLLPFIGIAFVLSLFLKQIPLSDVAGLVARGEAIGGEEAEALEAARRAGILTPEAETIEAETMLNDESESSEESTPRGR